MRHPFQSIPPGKLGRAFVGLLLATLVVMAALNVVHSPNQTAAAPMGIVSFELAGDAATAQAILDSWNATARLRAAFGLGFDFLFLVLYSTTFGLACVWAARGFAGRSQPLHSIGLLLAWGQWLAAALDGAENVALLAILLGSPDPRLPQWAWGFASAKFVLIVVGLAYAAWGGALWIAGRLSAQRSRGESRY